MPLTREQFVAAIVAALTPPPDPGPEGCDFDYKQRTLGDGTYCRRCRCHHFGV